MRLRLSLSIALLLVAALAIPLLAADPQETAIRDAQQAAESWLALVDAAKYDDSWSSASALFQEAITLKKWRRVAQAAREPLGKIKSRTFKTATYSTSLPGAPDGEYVVVEYQTTFEHRPDAIEKIIPMRDAGGRWRVSGYYVR